MVIWKGGGILGIVIPTLFYFAVAFLFPKFDTRFENNDSNTKNTVFLATSLLSGATLFPLGRWMNRPVADTPFDPNTGAEVEQGATHTMFFIPLQFWGIIWPAIGLFKYF
jgi:hypothetical protein